MPTAPAPPGVAPVHSTPAPPVEPQTSPPAPGPEPVAPSTLAPFGWTDEEERLLAVFASPAPAAPGEPAETTPDERLARAVQHQVAEEARDRQRRQPRGAGGKIFVTEKRKAVVAGHRPEAPGPGIGDSPDKKERYRLPLHESPNRPKFMHGGEGSASGSVGSDGGSVSSDKASRKGQGEPRVEAEAQAGQEAGAGTGTEAEEEATASLTTRSKKKKKRKRGKRRTAPGEGETADEEGPALAVEADMAAPLLALFRLLDPELKGHVSGANFALALKAAGTQLSHAEVFEIMERFGMEENGDDTVIGEPVKLTNTAPHKTRTLKSIKAKARGKSMIGGVLNALAMASGAGVEPEPSPVAPPQGSASSASQAASQGGQEEQSPTGSVLTGSEDSSRAAEAAVAAGAAVAGAEAASQLFDRRINYEQFCLTGRMLQVRAGDQPVPPVDAWITRQKYGISNASHLRKAVAKNILIRKIAGQGNRTLRARKVSEPLLFDGAPPMGSEVGGGVESLRSCPPPRPPPLSSSPPPPFLSPRRQHGRPT